MKKKIFGALPGFLVIVSGTAENHTTPEEEQ